MPETKNYRIIKIPRQYRVFSKGVIIIVNAKQEAKIFLLKEETMQELVEFKIEKPKYSDKEGFFGVVRNKKMTVPSPSVGRSHIAEKLNNEFDRQFSKTIIEIFSRNNFSSIFIISSEPMIHRVKKDLPKNIKEKIEMEIIGNYFKFTPLKILEKIKIELDREIEKKKVTVIDEKTNKLLQRKNKL